MRSGILVAFIILSLNIILSSCTKAGTEPNPLLENNPLIKSDISVNFSIEAENNLTIRARWKLSEKPATLSHYTVSLLIKINDKALPFTRVYVDVSQQEASFTNLPVGVYTAELHLVAEDGGEQIYAAVEDVELRGEHQEANSATMAPSAPELQSFMDTGATGIDTSALSLAWEIPEETGLLATGEQAAIVYYSITWKETQESQEATHTEYVRGTEFEIYDLQQDTEYSFFLRAYNNAGMRSEEAIERFHTKRYSVFIPGKPECTVSAQTIMGTGSISLQWTGVDPGTTLKNKKEGIAAYTVYWKKDQMVSVSNYDGKETLSAAADDIYNVRIDELAATSTYFVLVEAKNYSNLYSLSEIVNIQIPPAGRGILPSEPRNLSVSTTYIQKEMILVRFVVPYSFGRDMRNRDLKEKGYTIYWQKGRTASKNSAHSAFFSVEQFASRIHQGEEVREIVLPISGYGTYTFMVTAHAHITGEPARIFEGNVSSTSSLTIAGQAAAPGSAVSVVKEMDNTIPGGLTITWEAGEAAKDENGNPADTLYEVYYSAAYQYHNSKNLVHSGTKVTEEAITGLSITLSHLDEATPYDVVIRSVNAAMPEYYSDTPILTFVSNGLADINILHQGVKVNGKTLTLVYAPRVIALEYAIISGNTNKKVLLSSSNPEVVWINDGQAYIRGIGTSELEVVSRNNSNIRAEVTIHITPQDIGSSYIHYNIPFTVTRNKDHFFPVESNIPLYAFVNYRVVTGEDIQKDIHIDTESGTITVRKTIAAGTYFLRIIATASGEFCSGYAVKTISISVGNAGNVFYKPDMHAEARNYFTSGDIQNPYLFLFPDLSAAHGSNAEITITDDNNIQYYARVLPVRSFVTKKDRTTFVIGTGPDMSMAEFEQIPVNARLTIAVTVWKGAELHAQHSVNVRKSPIGSIYSWRDLQTMRNDLDIYYTLECNIIFPTPGEYGFSSFEPIGRDTDNVLDGFQGEPFRGIFNGNNKSITNFMIDQIDLSYAGLFGKVEGKDNSETVIYDLEFVNPVVRAGSVAGILAGNLHIGQVRNIAINNENTGNGKLEIFGKKYAGAIVGKADSSVSILDVSSTVNVLSKSRYIGGLVGFLDEGVQLIGKVNADVQGTNYVGGLAGYAGKSSRISGSASGSVTGVRAVGGLAGELESYSVLHGRTDVAISGTFSIGGLAGTVGSYTLVQGSAGGTLSMIGSLGNNIGGLVGYARHIQEAGILQDRTKIEGYATGVVWTNNGSAVGGLVGYASGINLIGYMTGTLIAEGEFIGGLAGIFMGRALTGYVAGSIHSTDTVGILCGIFTGKMYAYWDKSISKVLSREIADRWRSGGDVFAQDISSIRNVVYNPDTDVYTDTRGTVLADDDVQVFDFTYFTTAFTLYPQSATWPGIQLFPYLPETEE